jgi:two-component system, NtrC family, sensor kinase
MECENSIKCKALEAFRKKLVIISLDYKILAVNQHALKDLNESITGEFCYKVFFGNTMPCKECPATEVMLSGRPSVRHFQKNINTSEKIQCLYSYPILSENKQTEGIVVLDFEVPTIGFLEDKLRRSNAFFRNLILSSVDAVIAADIYGNILIFNDMASTISGYSAHEALTQLNIKDLYPGNVAFMVMKKLRSEEYGGKGKLKSYQVDFLRKTGEVIPISLNASVIYEGQKEVATIGYFHDLRDELKMKKKLEKAQSQLLQAEKMASLGKLAAGVAHQLNNPLGGITLFTQLVLEDYDLPEKAKDDLNRILKDAQRCRDTVKELLEFARQTRQEMQAHDLNKAISRTLFLLENQTLFHNIRINKQLASSLPPVHGDIQQLNHLLMNIILNAAEAMEGQGELTIKTETCEDKKRLLIAISDTGPGIPDHVRPHIFEPFFTTKEPGKGTGLGLSMVYGIVENHGGKIHTLSREGEGTTFIIELLTADCKNGEKFSEPIA